jgi:hypothetical protein
MKDAIEVVREARNQVLGLGASPFHAGLSPDTAFCLLPCSYAALCPTAMVTTTGSQQLIVSSYV